jgi:RHS repeat-associated protein
MKKFAYSALSLAAVFFISTVVYSNNSKNKKDYSSLAIELSTARTFAVNDDKGGIDVIDPATGAVTTTILRHMDIAAMALDEQRKILAVAGGRKLHVISTETLAELTSIPIRKAPVSLALSPDLGLALITHEGDSVSIIDLNSYTVLKEIAVSKHPVSVAIDPVLKLAVIAHHARRAENHHHHDQRKDNITIMELNNFTVIKTLPAGKAPGQVSVNAATHQAVVVNEKSDDLTLIDLTTQTITGTIAVRNHPKASSYNECLNTVSIIGGEHTSWLQVISMETGTSRAYTYDRELNDVEVLPSLNKAIIAGRGGLVYQNLPNPVPVLTEISPATAQRGAVSSDLTVTGAGLLATTAVYLNGNSAETSFQSCGNIKVTVPDAYLENAGQLEIKAISPTPEGGASNLLYLNVVNPAPSITALQPNQASAGAPGITLTALGWGFFNDTILSVNNAPRSFTLLSLSQLRTTLTGTDLENGGYLDITVSNPLPGGGTSTPVKFTVLNPAPTLTSVDPTTLHVNADTTLVLTGNNFTKTSTVYFNNQPFSANFINATRIEATIPASALKNAGTYPVKAVTPAPGGGETASVSVAVIQQNPNVQPLPEGSFGKQYSDLIPMDATVTAYDPKRFAIVTGLVQDRNQGPISGVTVSLLGLPQYGTAQTDATGRFNLPVDGGGVITVVFQKTGFITSHRQANTPWNDIINAETVTMLTEDIKATTIAFDGNPNTVLTHTSTPITDSRGTRSLTMVFSGDNRATITDANGQQVVRTSITTRATEFDTPASMPAKLPPTSAYTYCSELSVDGAKSVKFYKPVTMYVDNFLGFNVGEVVPVGYYDRIKGVWMASDNGMVVKLLDTNGDGVVDAIDTVGDGLPHDTNIAGLTDSAKFKSGSTYWRVTVDHFSPWDHNWPFGPPMDATPPNPDGTAVADQEQEKDDKTCNASYCESRSRIMHEDVPISGAAMTLHYASNRVQGYKTVVTVPASGSTVSASLTRIIVRMEVAGRVYQSILPPSHNQKAEFIWDGLDHLGNPVVGSRIANISVGFGYVPVYYSVSDFARAWERIGNSSTGIRGGGEIVLWKNSTLVLQRSGFGSIAEGWTLSAHHLLSPSAPNTLIKGDGTISEYNANIITTIAGNGQSGHSGDGSAATFAAVNQPYGVAADSAGNIYIADPSTRSIRKVDTNGIITTVAGNGKSPPDSSGDGGPAVQASLVQPFGVAVDSKGNIYIADGSGSRVRKVDAGGVITTVAGIGTWGFSGDEGPAVRAKIASPYGVAVDNSGNMYIADLGNSRIRKVDSSGVITTVAGNGQFTYSGDGGPAVQASINQPYAVAVDGAGNVYIADRTNYRIRKVDASGIISTVAGNGSSGFSGDGVLAVQAKLSDPRSIAVDSVGNFYIADLSYAKIRKVDTNGIITTVAGNGQYGFSGDAISATKASLYYPYGVAVDKTGNIYIADTTNRRVRKVSTPVVTGFPQYAITGDILFPEENGQAHIFSSAGLHKSTLDLATGKTLITFGYDTNNQLISVTDRFGNQTAIQRDGRGRPTSITSPDGLISPLTIDGNNNLTKVAYPDGSHYSFDYTPEGLLMDEYDQRNSHFIHNYDANGRIMNVSDPQDGIWTYTHALDYAGNITATVQTGEGNTTTYRDRTDSTGAYTSIKTEPTGKVTTISRSSDELTETISPSCGMNQSLKYDLDPQYKFKYLSGSTATSPAGLKLTSAFLKTYQDTNADNKPDVITDLVSQNTRTWTTINNNQTGTITSTSPAGRTITATYDPTSLLTQQLALPGFTPTTFSYDTRGRILSAATGSRTTTITYDTNGYPNKLVTPDNKTYTYTNDAMGRFRTIQQPGNTTINYDYDANGNMTVLTNPNTITNGFDYTANNQRKTWTTPLSGNYLYTYDKERKLKTVTFPSGKIISNTYTHGLLTSTNTPEGITNYAYGCGSNLASATNGSESIAYTYDGTLLKTDTRTGALNQAISYAYNNDFRIASLTYVGLTQNLGYDNDGLLITAGPFTITRNAQNGLPERVGDNTLLLARAFSGYGEINQNTYAVGGNALYDWTLTRDNAGRITRRVENIQGSTITWDYAYDQLSRLIEVKQNDSVVESYTYDANGNRLVETNVLRGISNQAYTYSNEDNVITAGTNTYQFDKDGFLTGMTTAAGTSAFSYSSRGELLNARLPDGRDISYDHDTMGRRVAKRVNGAVVEKYLWQGMIQLLAVYDGSNTLVSRFNYADARMPVSMTQGGNTYYLAYDQVGSLRLIMDTTGAVVKQIDYDSFGSIISDSNPAMAVPFGFAGGLHDRDTGLVRFGFRDYDPVNGMFISKDPIGFRGGLNLYAYVGNNPVNYTDPFGLQASSGTGTCPPKKTCQQQADEAYNKCMAGMSKGPGNMSTTTCIGTAVGIGLGVGLGNKIIGGVIAGGGTLICISGLLPDTATSTGQGLCQMQKQQILNNCQASGE